MSDTIKYISKVEIKGLWGRYDLEWNLNEDVNVLSGINGSGKSTILNCVYGLLNFSNISNIELFNQIEKYIGGCKISFDSGGDMSLFIERNDKMNNSNRYVSFSPDFLADLHESLQIDIIKTFDTELKPLEAVQKLSGTSVKTELDWEISELQKRYLSYQIDIGKRAFEAISNNEINGKLLKIRATYERFLSLIDELFHETGKKINRDDNQLSFMLGEEKLTAYELSSGEKQLLIILLTVLVQDNRQAILFMDEPELSLHYAWQKKLIQYIRELNPYVQIILATHSGAIIREGWMDKVSNVSDLIKLA